MNRPHRFFIVLLALMQVCGSTLCQVTSSSSVMSASSSSTPVHTTTATMATTLTAVTSSSVRSASSSSTPYLTSTVTTATLTTMTSSSSVRSATSSSTPDHTTTATMTTTLTTMTSSSSVKSATSSSTPVHTTTATMATTLTAVTSSSVKSATSSSTPVHTTTATMATTLTAVTSSSVKSATSSSTPHLTTATLTTMTSSSSVKSSSTPYLTSARTLTPTSSIVSSSTQWETTTPTSSPAVESSSSESTATPSPSPTELPSSSSSVISATTAPVPSLDLHMYPYGPDAEDGSDDRYFYWYWRCVEFSMGYKGFLFFGKRHYKLHVCRNGLISFEQPWYRFWPYKFGQYWWFDSQPLLAPYWSLIDQRYSFRDGPSKLYYHIYQKGDGDKRTQSILTRATEDVDKHWEQNQSTTRFEATWVMVITWFKLRHWYSIWREDIRQLYNTFQAVLITNGVHSFVMYNYPNNGIQWSAPTHSSNNWLYWYARALPVVGINSGDFNKLSNNHPRSASVTIGDIDELEGLNIFKSKSNSFDVSPNGIRGRLFFRLEDSVGKDVAEIQCIDWFERQHEISEYIRWVEPCPCTFWQALRDRRFRWTSWSWPRYCFYSSFQSPHGLGQECCYVFFRERRVWWGWWWGSFLASGYPDGGTVHRYHRYRQPFMHQIEDRKPYERCCVHSDMCWMYYERRPSDTCERYIPPRWSWFWGDPHFVTLDNKNYTFNGLGEFVMLDAKQGHFQLQARTKLAKGDGKATVFSGAVAKETNTSTVQVLLGDNGTLEVSVDGQPFNINNLTNTTQQLNGSVDIVKPQKNCFEMGFPSGMSVKVCENLNQLSIIAAAPDSFKNQTKGLLGTWNGDVEDDFTLPNGTVLPSSISGRDVHYNFGMAWQVTENTTLFTYKPGESIHTYMNTSFKPTFIEDYMSSFGNDSLKKEAEALCNGDVSCLFDIASTKDLAAGESAKQINSQLVNDSKKMSNGPPRIDNSSTVLYLTVNQTVTIVVNATDPDGDAMTFNVSGIPSDAKVTTGLNSIQVSWKVTNAKLDLRYIVTDSNDAVSSIKPTTYLCACHNGASCSKPTIIAGSNSTGDKFVRMLCSCTPGFTGVTCESDIDACEANLNPCYPGVKCIDLPAPANMTTGYECGPCPSGFSGNGADCSDIDECKEGKSGCSQICANKPGSFECSCTSGYQLKVDRKTCDDINECTRGSDCMHICTNTIGSYTCSCNEYFKVDPNNNKLCLPKNPCIGGEHGCQHVCYQDNDQNQKCACNQGYKLNDDGKTCSDIDECATNKYRCNQKCHNTKGSYTCSCVSGFELSKDNFTCADINECMRWTFNCSDPSQICENTQGSYKCICEEGLYLINNKCTALRPGATIPPPPTAPTPKEPSQDETANAVSITMENLNVKEWNKPKEDKFKQVIAEGATSYCGIHNVCHSSSSKRVRRSTGFITFTADQVHLLPGFPVQINSDKYPASSYVARIAIYLNYPPGVALETQTPLKVVIFLKVLNSSRGEIEKALNVTVVEIKGYKTEQSSTPSDNNQDDDKLIYIIVGAVVGGVVLIVLIVLAIYCFKKHTKPAKLEQNDTRGQDNQGMESRMAMYHMKDGEKPEIGKEVILKRHSTKPPRGSSRVAPIELS